jgi:hypothetical protein
MKHLIKYLAMNFVFGSGGIVVGAEILASRYLPATGQVWTSNNYYTRNEALPIYLDGDAASVSPEALDGLSPVIQRTYGTANFTLGQMRYPGTRGGYYVFPYRGQGVYTFSVRLTSGIYNLDGGGWDAVSGHGNSNSASSWGPAHLAATTQALTTDVPYHFYNNSAYTKLVGIFGTYDSDTAYDYGQWNARPPYFGDLFAKYIHYYSPASQRGLFYLSRNYTINTLGLPARFANEGYADFPSLNRGTVTPVDMRKVDLTFKVTIDATNANANWKHFVLKDWFSAGQYDTESDGEVATGNVEIISATYSNGAMSGVVTAPVLMEGYKGNIPIQFSVTKE